MTDPCPNPKCQNGEVPGGSKGWLICPDCKGATKRVPILAEDADGKPVVVYVVKAADDALKAAGVGQPGPRSYPDSTENPLGPPTVDGTEVTRPT